MVAVTFGYHDLERAALGYVLEDENWAAFLQWFGECHVTVQSHEWLEANPNLDLMRLEYMLHGPE